MVVNVLQLDCYHHTRPQGYRIRIHRRATRVGAFEVFEAAHVVSRRPEIDRSNNSQPVKASQFVRDLY